MAKISLDLARSGRIFTVFQNFLAGYYCFSYFLGWILAVFQIINPDQDPTTFQQEPSNSIRFSDCSAAGLKNWNRTWSGRSQVGHKLDTDRPVVTPSINKVMYRRDENHSHKLKPKSPFGNIMGNEISLSKNMVYKPLIKRVKKQQAFIYNMFNHPVMRKRSKFL